MSQWSKSMAYVARRQPHVENKQTAQAVRPTKLGVMKWKFNGHPHAGHNAAISKLILEFRRHREIEPPVYLIDLLRRLSGVTNHEMAEA